MGSSVRVNVGASVSLGGAKTVGVSVGCVINRNVGVAVAGSPASAVPVMTAWAVPMRAVAVRFSCRTLTARRVWRSDVCCATAVLASFSPRDELPNRRANINAKPTMRTTTTVMIISPRKLRVCIIYRSTIG